MSDISTKASVSVELNTEEVKNKIKETEQKVSGLKAELAAAFKIPDNSANVKRLRKELQGAEHDLKIMRSSAANVNAALAQLAQSTPRELRQTIKDINNLLNSGSVKRGSQEWDYYVNALAQVKQELKDCTTAQRLFAEEGESGFKKLIGSVSRWWGAIDLVVRAYDSIDNIGKKMRKDLSDLQASSANLQALTGLDDSSIEWLTQQAATLSTTMHESGLRVKESVQEILEAYMLVGSNKPELLGDKESLNAVTIETMRLASAAGMNLKDAVAATTTALNQYGAGADEAAKYVNILAAGSKFGASNVQEQASSILKAGTAAASANVPMEQLVGCIEMLGEKGIKSEVAGTGLKKFFLTLQTGASETNPKVVGLETALTNLQNQVEAAEQKSAGGGAGFLKKMFGEEGFTIASVLTQNTQKVKEYTKAVTGSKTAMEQAAINSNTYAAKTAQLNNKIQAIGIELAKRLTPAIAGSKELLVDIYGFLPKVITFLGDIAGTITALVVAIVGYNLYLESSIILDKLKLFWNEKVIASFRNLWHTLLANPYASVAAAIGVVIGVVIDLTRRTDALSEAQKTLNEIQSEAKKKAAEQEQEIKTLMAAAKNMNLTYDEQKTAVDKLNKLIPHFNGRIDATTRAFSYSEQALKNYNDELVRLYELEGAREKLKELGRKKADALIKYNEAEKSYRAAEANGVGQAYTTSWGSVGYTGQDLIDHTKIARDAAKAEVDNIKKQVDSVLKVFGEDLQREAVRRQAPASPTSNITAGGGSGGGSHGGGNKDKPGSAAEKKRKAEEEKKAKQEFKDDVERVKKNLADQNTAALNAYNKGEIDYVTYLDRKQAASEKYYKAAEEVYKKHGLEESDDLAKLRQNQAEEDKKYKEARNKMLKEQYAQERDLAKVAANMEYYNPDNKEAYHNQRVLDEKLAQIDLEYLRKVLKAQTEGSQEYEAARRALEKAERDEELRQRKKLEEDLTAWLYIYSQKGAKNRMDAELLVAKQLYEQKKLLEEEYQEAVAAIQKKYRDEVNSKTGTKAKNQDFDDAADTYKNQMAALEDARKQGLISQEDYESRKWQIVQNYHNKIVELVKGEGSDWGAMLATLVETWKAGFEDLGSTTVEKMKSISSMAAAAFAVMNAGITSYTNYANASRDLEVKKVEDSYDAQIKAAGKNDKKKQKLEEEKQKEVSKIKTKYDKRAMAMEMAQAVSSTALGAINAYASAAEVPMVGYMLAPVAAAMALAAGAVQIATIKKQHQVQQMGYYEGGFTGRSTDNRREVGVVHANEFVANHKAVSNPQLLPVLRLIDQAQRNNTVGSLTSEDVSRAIGQGAILGDMTATQQRTAEQHDTSMVMVAASMERQTDAINELNARLADGIESFMVMDGERGFERRWAHYQRMHGSPKR